MQDILFLYCKWFYEFLFRKHIHTDGRTNIQLRPMIILYNMFVLNPNNSSTKHVLRVTGYPDGKPKMVYFIIAVTVFELLNATIDKPYVGN